MAVKKDKKDASKTTIAAARRVLDIEAAAVSALKGRLDHGFERAVDLILATKGKVVVTGIGKSGLICQKIASTLASTGTAALFLHPAESAHGDLGVLGRGDLVLAVSNSGETEEIVRMLRVVKRMGIPLVAMTGRKDSTIARYADVTIDVGVREEACPLGLAPTASTTATLAMGDALAVVLLERRGFREEDFATLHPAGSLGRKLMKVGELMHPRSDIPRVTPQAGMKDVIHRLSAPSREGAAGAGAAVRKRVGITGVFRGRKLVGVITDGDLRRALERGTNVLQKKAGDVMSGAPKLISEFDLAEAALKVMEDHSITALFVHRSGRKDDIAGIVYLHDLIRAGVI